MQMKVKRHFLHHHRSRSGSSVASESSNDSHSDDSRSRASHSSTTRNNCHNNERPTSSGKEGDLAPAVLVYHESARSIVFRDHVRRAADVAAEQLAASAPTGTIHSSLLGNRPMSSEEKLQTRRGTQSEHFVHQESSSSFSTDMAGMASLFGAPECAASDSNRSGDSLVIQGYQPQINPLPTLQLGPKDQFEPLLLSEESTDDKYWTEAEREVHDLLMTQKATVKTVKNSEWTSFLHRFKVPHKSRGSYPTKHDDFPPRGGDSGTGEGDFPFVSFVTPTSLLPAGGFKMRCYGANETYTTGVVFALPDFGNETHREDEVASATGTWCWPSGYSAKTEFNVDSRGELINGRAEALIPVSKMRELNDDYITKSDYVVAGKLLKGGLKTVPYNEVFLRVGGKGRIVGGKDTASGETQNDTDGTGRSFDKGVGLPIALFVRSATFGHLISLLRTRARLLHIFGEKHVRELPLLMITPEIGIRVLTENLQHQLLKVASRELNPFQNSLISHKTKINDTDPAHLQTKLEELIHLDEKIRATLTKDELVRIAGGFGATDDSIAQILRDAMIQDKQHESNGGDIETSHELQDIVNEGLASAVRSGDYYTSRQLLILYSLVSSEAHQMDVAKQEHDESDTSASDEAGKAQHRRKPSLDSNAMILMHNGNMNSLMSPQDVKNALPPPPPPPPLDTDRLRSATNSDGLLAVLGAAQILKAMQDGSAKKRTEECFLAVEEWVSQGEQSMAFRLASWRDQRAAQDDLEIAVDRDSSFMAFVSNKAISNRKNFAQQLRQSVEQTDFNNMRFLAAIYEITNRMHSPCLRLELLQYALGLDNRYSIAHVRRAVELAATCLSISSVAQPVEHDDV